LRARDEQEKNTERDVNSEPSIEITDYDMDLQKLSANEIALYSFNYVGVLTGSLPFLIFIFLSVFIFQS